MTPGAEGVVLAFTVHGRPTPQGSHTPVITPGAAGAAKPRTVRDPATGRTLTYGAAKRPRVWMKDSSTGLGAYRDSVALSARSAAARAGLSEPLAEPMATLLTFVFARPKNGRAWPDTRATGDVDKLERAVHDALTAARVVTDDAKIVGGAKIMCFADRPAHPAGLTHVTVVPVAVFCDMMGSGVLTLPDMSG